MTFSILEHETGAKRTLTNGSGNSVDSITMPAADDVAHVGMAAAPTLVGERADVSIAKGPSMCVMWVDGSGALATDGRRKAKVESNFDLGGAGAFGVPA